MCQHVPFNAWVFGCSLAGIMGSNPAFIKKYQAQ